MSVRALRPGCPKGWVSQWTGESGCRGAAGRSAASAGATATASDPPWAGDNSRRPTRNGGTVPPPATCGNKQAWDACPGWDTPWIRRPDTRWSRPAPAASTRARRLDRRRAQTALPQSPRCRQRTLRGGAASGERAARPRAAVATRWRRDGDAMATRRAEPLAGGADRPLPRNQVPMKRKRSRPGTRPDRLDLAVERYCTST